MAQRKQDNLPQVVAIASLYGDGKLSFVKRVRQEVADDGDTFYVQVGDEVLVTAQPIEGVVPAEFTGRYLLLPEVARTALAVDAGDRVAIVQRADGVALKGVTIEERPGEHAAAFDIETPHSITRIVQTNPDPDAIVPHLREQYRDMALQHEVTPYLRNRKTLAAWQARRVLKEPDADDGLLREALIEERLAQQNDDGSWAGDVVATARHLRELAELGLTVDETAIRRGVDWLIARRESYATPGMGFGSDELGAQQAQVLAQREAGQGGRYREIRSSEQ